MGNKEHSAFIRGKIVAICKLILNEDVGLIAGSRILCGLEYELFHREAGWTQHEADFIPVVAINSETDPPPVDGERKNWSVEALQRKDEEIAKAEAFYKE